MKKTLFVLFLALLLTIPCLYAQAEDSTESVLSARQQLLFDTVRYCNDLPKNAQILTAMEYYCKAEGYPLRLLLMTCTQNAHIESLFGVASSIVIFDTDTSEMITYANVADGMSAASKSDMLSLLFNHYDAYLNGYNEFIYADHEMAFPFSEEEISAVNALLLQHFTR